MNEEQPEPPDDEHVSYNMRINVATGEYTLMPEAAPESEKARLVAKVAFAAAQGSANGDDLRAEKKWCAWCGKWGNHTSGGCDDLHAELLARRRAEEGNSPNDPKLSDSGPGTRL